MEIPDIQDFPNSRLEIFIEDAHLLVVENLADKGLSVARLELVERWLTAHLVTQLIERGGLTSSEVDNASETYGGSKDSGLASTRFGQQAIVFDTSGTLKEMSMQVEVKALKGQFRVM